VASGLHDRSRTNCPAGTGWTRSGVPNERSEWVDPIVPATQGDRPVPTTVVVGAAATAHHVLHRGAERTQL